MTREEKEKQLTRIQKRLLRFQTLLLHNIEYENNNTGNRFDDVFLNVWDKMRPAFHARQLALSFYKIKAIKTE